MLDVVYRPCQSRTQTDTILSDSIKFLRMPGAVDQLSM
jgi:hypothetical protein